jgi:hypothetical protein
VTATGVGGAREQNERDHAALARAVKQGKVKAEFEESR